MSEELEADLTEVRSIWKSLDSIHIAGGKTESGREQIYAITKFIDMAKKRTEIAIDEMEKESNVNQPK